MVPAHAIDAFLAQLRTQCQGQLLVGDLFGMGEGEYEEHPEPFVHLQHVSALPRFTGEHPCQAVAGIHVRGVAEGVARKLVEQDHQRQRAVRGLDPVITAARGGGHVQ